MKHLILTLFIGGLWLNTGRADQTVFVNCVHFFVLGSPSFGYDDVDLADRPLDWDTSMSFEQSVLKKAQYILDIGGDVFQYAVPFGYYNTSSSSYDPALDFQRLKDIHDILVAHNIPLTVNFETSGFNTQYNSGKYTAQNITAFLDYAAVTVSTWPKIFKYNGKVVFTLWNIFGTRGDLLTSGFTPTVYGQCLSAMGSGNRAKLYIVNDSYHTYLQPASNWNSSYIRGLINDGLFDNIELWATSTDGEDGLRQTYLKADLNSVSAAIPFAVCLSNGYFRRNTLAFKRHYGTQHFFDHWKSRVEDASPEWITVITLDDYTENHHIEPSVLNNGFWINLLKTALKNWRGESNTLSPEYWLAAPQTDVWGQNMHMEVVELNSAGTDHKIKVELNDQNGAVFATGPAKCEDDTYCGGTVKIHRFDYAVTDISKMDAKALRPVVYRYSSTGIFERTYWGCPPTRLFYSIKPGTLYRYTPLHNLISVSGDSGADISNVVYTDRGEYLESSASYSLDAKGDTLEYAEVRGGYDEHLPLYSTNALSGSTASFSVTLDSRDMKDAAAMTYLYYRTTSGKMYFSAPAIQANNASGHPYTLFDKTIDLADYNNKSSYFDQLDTSFRFRAEESVVADWDFSQTSTMNIKGANYKVVPSNGNHWGRPLYLGYGPNKKTFFGSTANEPTIATSGLDFNGVGEVCRLPDYLLPEGAYGIYLKFNTRSSGREQVLVYAKGLTDSNVRIGIDSSNRLYFERNNERITSSSGIATGTDYEVWFYDNGQKQAIVMDGTYDAERTYPAKAKSLYYHRNNDLVLVGDDHNHTDGNAFAGVIKSMAVASVLPADGHWGASPVVPPMPPVIAAESFKATSASDDYTTGTHIVDTSNYAITNGNIGFGFGNKWANATGSIRIDSAGLSHSGVVGTAPAGSLQIQPQSNINRNSRRILATTPELSETYFMSGLVRLSQLSDLRGGQDLSVGFEYTIAANTYSVANGMHIGVRRVADSGLGGTAYLTASAGGNSYDLLDLTGHYGETFQVVLQLDVDASGADTLTAWYAATGDAKLTEALPATSVETWNGVEDLRMLVAQEKSTYAYNPFGARFDELRLGKVLSDVTTFVDASAFNAWLAGYPGVGTSTNLTDNPDGDSLNNLDEWGLGGNPADPDDIGHVPTSGTVVDGGSTWFEFIYAKRNDAATLGLDYHLKYSTNLVDGVWTDKNYETGIGTLDSEFDAVTNRIPTEAEEAQFLQLILEYNP